MFFSLVVVLIIFILLICLSFPWAVKQWRATKDIKATTILFLLMKYVFLLLGILALTYIIAVLLLGAMGHLSH